MTSRVIKGTHPQDPNENRRKAKRRPILDTFSLFAVVNKKSVCRLKIHDVSELGIAFDFDVEGETVADFPLQEGEELELQLYLNQTLHLPLGIRVVRIEGTEKSRKVGAEYADKASKSYQALQAFIMMLDRVTDIAQIDPNPAAAASSAPAAPAAPTPG